MKTINLLILTALSGALVLSSCSKKEGCTDPNSLNYDPNAEKDNGTCVYSTPPPTPTATTGSVTMHFHSSWESMSTDFHLDSIYTLTSTVGGVPDRQIKFTSAKFYVSKVALDADTTNSYLLVDPTSMMYSIGDVDAGSYSNLYFTIGLDSATNHSDPTVAASPLNQTDMHWNWNTSSGYKFIKLEGQIDTSATGNAGTYANFVYHVATDAMRRNASFSITQTITAGQSHTLNYHVMWNKFFDGVNVASALMQHGGGTTNTAISDNASGVFMIMP